LKHVAMPYQHKAEAICVIQHQDSQPDRKGYCRAARVVDQQRKTSKRHDTRSKEENKPRALLAESRRWNGVHDTYAAGIWRKMSSVPPVADVLTRWSVSKKPV
jgi:hypothetical protein